MDNDRLMGLRLLLKGDNLDTSLDETIILLDKMATNRLGFLIKNIKKGFNLPVEDSTIIPDDLTWILDEVIVRRFNRIGSEGYSSQSVEGHSVSFSTNDFQEFLNDIHSYYEPDTYSRVRPGEVVLI